eukprot:233431_1
MSASPPTVADEQKESQRDIGKKVESIWKKKYYFITYGFLFIYLGVFWSLPSVIFNALKDQLNVSEEKMASLYTYFSISGTILCISSGFIVDKFPKMHYLIALVCVFGIIAICLIYFITNFIAMVFIWLVLAAVQYLIEVTVIVLVFRVFNIDGAFLIGFYYFIGTISSVIVAPLFNAFYNDSGNYSYCMYILSSFGLCATIFLMFVPSPQRSDLLRDVENIKNDIVNNNIRELGDIEKYKKDNTKLTYTKPMVYKYASSQYIQCELERNHVIINELHCVYKIVPKSNETEHNIMYNLFTSVSCSILPYSYRQDAEAESLTDQKNMVSVIDESYWFDFEQRRKKDVDLSPKRSNITNLFAVIAVVNMFVFIVQRVSFNAFIVEVSSDYFLLSESTGYYLITANWIGAVCGRVATMVVITLFSPENVMVFCSSFMVLNSALYCVLLSVSNGVVVEVLLYVVAFQTGFWSNPLHAANLAFLSHIQPVTGVLSASIMVAEAVARGVAALMTAVIIEYTGKEAQIYIHLTTSIIALCLMTSNKIRYLFFLKQ